MTATEHVVSTPVDQENRPLLSICIPTFRRPEGLATALHSVRRTASPDDSGDVEVVVSDNGCDDPVTPVTESVMAGWRGPVRHVVHNPSLGMVGNFNACVQLARGTWVLVLHDDDYLIGDGVAGIIDAVRRASADERVLLFGVHVVTPEGTIRHRQSSRRATRLSPSEAIDFLVADSSSVRFPSMVVHRDAYRHVGQFDTDMAEMTDYDMWLRLFSAFGVTLRPEVSAAYVVHPAAATERLFTRHGIDLLQDLFARVGSTALIERGTLERRQRRYLHKWILAGVVRRLRARDVDGARQVLRLFAEPDVRTLGWSARWAPLRAALTVVLGRQRGTAERPQREEAQGAPGRPASTRAPSLRRWDERRS